MDTARRKDGGAFARAVGAATRAELPIANASKHDLNTLVDNRPHQVLGAQQVTC